MRYRINNEVQQRLSGASTRHGLSQAEIARRACRKWVSNGRVNVSAHRETSTRDKSQVIEVTQLSIETTGTELSAIIAWYLHHNDNGETPVRMAPNHMSVSPDGVIKYTGPVTSDYARTY